MNEFLFTKGSLEAQGLQEGSVVECTYSIVDYLTAGKVYKVVKVGDALHVVDDDGTHLWADPRVKFKPVQVNAPQQQGQKLQYILPTCKTGDVLECVYAPQRNFTLGKSYIVSSNLYIVNNAGSKYKYTVEALFVKKDVQSNCTQTKVEHDMNQHDSWGIGKSYNAPKKEWKPDVLDVDLTKKLREG